MDVIERGRAPGAHRSAGRQGPAQRSRRDQAWRQARAVVRLGRLGAHLLGGLITTRWVFPRCSDSQRASHIQRWSAAVLRCLGVSYHVHGDIDETTQLIVANHVSWLDIMAIHTAAPRARFVAKAEVRRWPAAGRLAGAAGTLFVDRQSRSGVRAAAPMLAQAFAGGELVALFPEGTTTLGSSVLEFHASLLQPAIDAAVPIQAVGLRYTDSRGDPCRAAAYIDDDTLLLSIWRLAMESDTAVTVRVSPALQAGGPRRDLARHLRAWVAGAVELRT